jgi:methanogenic corrinoid protein MtbC1
MLSGDVAGSWRVIEAAMASGLEPDELYVRVLTPALHAIGMSWRSGGVTIDQEHLASGVAAALIGRLGPRFVRRGRKKGVVILAMPPGERHGLGVAMLADILTHGGFEVLNLGPDTPTASLVAAMREADHLAAVVVSVVDIGRRSAAERLLAAAGRERPTVPRLIGGHAIPDERAALDLGADGWVADPRALGDLIDALATRERPTGSSGPVPLEGRTRCRPGRRTRPRGLGRSGR